jgi:hypothetical protein
MMIGGQRAKDMHKKGRHATLQEILRRHYIGYQNEYFKIIDIRVKNSGLYIYCIQYYGRKGTWNTWTFFKEINKYFFLERIGIKRIQFHSYEQLISKREKT